jgi:hypothetical protein
LLAGPVLFVANQCLVGTAAIGSQFSRRRLIQLREDDVSPLPVAVSIYRAGEVYGITTCKDGGSNLPVMASPWQRQTETLLVEGTHPFGVDASQAIRDIARQGYHLITVQEMLRRSI